MTPHATSIATHGFTVIDDAFNPEIYSVWKLALAGLRERQQSSVYSTVSWFRHILELCPVETFEAVTQPVLLDLLEEMMGPFVQLDGVSPVGFSPVPDAKSSVRGWHRDRWAEFPSGTYTVPRAIHILCYLQDIDDESGPLRIIPGSHVRPVAIQPEDETLPHCDEQLVYPRSGQAVVLHNKVLHSGSLHKTAGLRSFCSTCFNQCWLPQPDDFTGPNCQRLRKQAESTGDRRLIRLLGTSAEFGAGFNRSNCGFLRPDKTYWDEWIDEDRDSAPRETARDSL